MCNALRHIAIALSCLFVFGACSPQLDWRELSAADGVIRVAYPAKARSETRPLIIAGQELPFTLSAAAVGRAVFAVGHVDLPPEVVADDSQRARYVRAMEESLAKNISAEAIERRDVEILNVRGAAGRSVPAHEIELHGLPNEQPAWILARILLVGNRLIEVAAVGPQDELSADVAHSFVNSVRVH